MIIVLIVCLELYENLMTICQATMKDASKRPKGNGKGKAFFYRQ
jgi:hypothetical protein